MVIVERKLENGENILMRSSPANGKLRFKNDFVQVKTKYFVCKLFTFLSRSPQVVAKKLTFSSEFGRGDSTTMDKTPSSLSGMLVTAPASMKKENSRFSNILSIRFDECIYMLYLTRTHFLKIIRL